jgi:hypothetical protein
MKRTVCFAALGAMAATCNALAVGHIAQVTIIDCNSGVVLTPHLSHRFHVHRLIQFLRGAHRTARERWHHRRGRVSRTSTGARLRAAPGPGAIVRARANAQGMALSRGSAITHPLARAATSFCGDLT